MKSLEPIYVAECAIQSLRKGLQPGATFGRVNYKAFLYVASANFGSMSVVSDVSQFSVDKFLYGNYLTENGGRLMEQCHTDEDPCAKVLEYWSYGFELVCCDAFYSESMFIAVQAKTIYRIKGMVVAWKRR